MTTPLHQLKAEFFKTLGHPTRVRVLELLSAGDRTVAEMLAETGVEASNLSQQLAVLRRAGLVSARREASTVSYSLANGQVAELLAVTRRILTTVLAGQVELLSDLQAESPAASRTGAGSATGAPRSKSGRRRTS